MPIDLNDPRVRKTRRGLQDALVRLILQQGYDSVTIQDIATEADTARITFYRHYRDKHELLTDCLNSLYDDLSAHIPPISAAGLQAGYTPIAVLYEHIEAHEALYRILFSTGGTQTVMERMRHRLAEHAMANLTRAGVQGGIPSDIIAHHVASGQIGLAIWWLDQNKPYPAAYMAQISLWLTLKGFFGAIGVTNFDLPVPGIEK